MSNNRTVVVIGISGSGISACANALAGSVLFKEGFSSTSCTRFVCSQTIRVDRSGEEYNLKIVDTIGLAGTRLSPDEELQRLVSACSECMEGINAVFYTTSRSCSKDEADAFYAALQVFGAEILDYTTIVRTKFEDFRNPAAVARDRKFLMEDINFKMGQCLPSIRYILHVDNVPLRYCHLDGCKEDRMASREILLRHLICNCQKVFRLPLQREVEYRIFEQKTANQEPLVQKMQRLEAQCKSTVRQMEQLCAQAAGAQRETTNATRQRMQDVTGEREPEQAASVAVVSDDEIVEAASRIESVWDKVAAFLDAKLFSQAAVDVIEKKTSSPFSRARTMLEQWKNSAAANATQQRLKNAMVRAGLRLQAVEVFGEMSTH